LREEEHTSVDISSKDGGQQEGKRKDGDAKKKDLEFRTEEHETKSGILMSEFLYWRSSYSPFLPLAAARVPFINYE